MADPTTSNVLLAVPTRGSDTGTWDLPLNSNSAAIDGFIGGVQTISVTNAPVTLSAPAGTVTPGAGPFQAQNATLNFTGALTANVLITLPLPSYYIIANNTTGNFLLSFRAIGSGKVIAVEQGSIQHIYNDGTNCFFANLGRVGSIEMWCGYAGVMPSWVGGCTTPPFLLCDGTVYNISSYPILGARLGSNFGGNGTTTFGVPDLRGRVALPYDSTAARITAGGAGFNGAALGAAGGNQFMQSHNHAAGVSDPGHAHSVSHNANSQNGSSDGGGGGGGLVFNSPATISIIPAVTNISVSIGFSGSGASQNVQPSIVTGISVIRAA